MMWQGPPAEGRPIWDKPPLPDKTGSTSRRSPRSRTMSTLPHRRQVRLSVHPRYREREPVTFQVNADFGNITDEVRIRRHENAHGRDSVLLRHSPHQATRLYDHLRRCDIVGRYTFANPVENFVHNLQRRGHGRIAQIL